MSANKKTADEKRTVLPRDSKKDDNFLKNWEKLSRSGKHDINNIKQKPSGEKTRGQIFLHSYAIIACASS